MILRTRNINHLTVRSQLDNTNKENDMDRYFFRNLFIFVTYLSAIRCGIFLERSTLRATSFLMADYPEETCYCPGYDDDYHPRVVRSPDGSRRSNIKEHRQYAQRELAKPRPGSGRRSDKYGWGSTLLSMPSIGIRHGEAIFWSVLVGGVTGFGLLRCTNSGEN